MKKFIKWGCILGCFLILIGVGLATAAFANGGEPEAVLRQLEERYGSYDYSHSSLYYTPEENWIEPEDIWNGPYENQAGPAILETVQEASDIQRWDDGNFTASYEDEMVSMLEIKQNGGTVHVTAADVPGVIVESTGGSLENLAYREIRSRGKLTVNVWDGEEYEITIPADDVLDKFEVQTAGGVCTVEMLQAEETELDALAGGVIHVSQDYAVSLELDSEYGEIYWEGENTMASQLEAECSGGTIEVTVPRSVDESAYSYEKICDNGEIKLFGETITGIQVDRTRGTDSNLRMSLEAKEEGTIAVAK